MDNKQEITYGQPLWKHVRNTFLNTLAGAFLAALIVATVGLSLDNRAIQIIAQLVGILIFLGMIYINVWSIGDRDKNLVSFGRIEKDMLKGLKIGLIVMIPYMLLSIIPILVLLEITPDITFIYRILNIYLVVMINSYMSTDAPSWSGVLITTSFFLTIPAVCTVSYILGYRRVSVMSNLVYSKDDKKKK